MKKLVVVADDFGLCESVNNGIMDAHKKGIVTELSLMLGSPSTDHALKIAKEQGVTNIGIHMLLKNWRDTGHLVHMPDYVEMFNELSTDDIAELVRAELAEFEAVVGHKPTHITSQYSIIGHPNALPAVIPYALANNIPMRQPSGRFTEETGVGGRSDTAATALREAGVATTDKVFAHMTGGYDEIKQLLNDDFAAMGQNETAEIILHPGYVSKELEQSSSLVHERERDTKLAMDDELKGWIENYGIKLVGYGAMLP